MVIVYPFSIFKAKYILENFEWNKFGTKKFLVQPEHKIIYQGRSFKLSATLWYCNTKNGKWKYE